MEVLGHRDDSAQNALGEIAIELANTPNNALNRLAIQQLRSEQQGTQFYLNDVMGAKSPARILQRPL